MRQALHRFLARDLSLTVIRQRMDLFQLVDLLQQLGGVAESELGRVESERQKLAERIDQIEVESQDLSDQFTEIERQNSDLASLYGPLSTCRRSPR